MKNLFFYATHNIPLMYTSWSIKWIPIFFLVSFLCHQLLSLSLRSTQLHVCGLLQIFKRKIVKICKTWTWSVFLNNTEVVFFHIFFRVFFVGVLHSSGVCLSHPFCPFCVCSTSQGSQIDKWTMDHMETHGQFTKKCVKKSMKYEN